MKKGAALFTASFREFKELRTVLFCALMAALAIVLKSVASIEVGQYIRIGFSGMPNRVVDYLFGPVTGAIFGGTLDILKYLVKPVGPYFPGFTLSAVTGSVIYGIFLYRKPLKLWRIAAAEFFVKLLVNCLMNTVWLTMLYGKVFEEIVWARIVTNMIMLPVDTILLFAVLQAVQKTVKPMLHKYQ